MFSTSSVHIVPFDTVLDSAPSEHIAGPETSSNLPAMFSPLRATVANGTSVPALGMTASTDAYGEPMRWHGLPGFPKDLTSLPQLCDHGYTFVLSPTGSRSIAILPDKRAFVIPRTGHHADGTKMWRMSYEVDTKTNSIRHVIPSGSMLPTGTTAVVPRRPGASAREPTNQLHNSRARFYLSCNVWHRRRRPAPVLCMEM